MRRDLSVYGYLTEHRDALCAEHAALLRESMPLYRALPEERLHAAVAAILHVFVEESVAGWTLEPVIAAAKSALRARVEAGLPRDDALQMGSVLRLLFLRRLGSMIEENVQEIPRFFLFLDELCAAFTEEIRRIYDDTLERAQRALLESEARYRQLVELSPDGVAVHDGERLLYVNPAGLKIMGREGYEDLEVISIFPPERRELSRANMRAAALSPDPTPAIRSLFLRPDGERVNVELLAAPIMFADKPARQIVFRDISERLLAEEALRQTAQQEEIIRAQEARLRELSTPLIPVSDDVVVVPLVGIVDEARARQLQEVLLQGISSTGAKVAILDVTGVPAMDADVARAILSSVAAARLLGAEVILTGIKPAAARALVALGVDFGRVVTKATLKQGIAHTLAPSRRR